MSDAALADDATKSVRVGRKARQESDEGALSPEEALKIAQATIRQQNETIRTVSADASSARAEAANATVARVGDRESQIVASIAAADMALASAGAAFRAARESGDVEAEAKALDLLGDAKFEHKKWTEEKAKLEAAKPQILADAKKKAEAPQGNAEYDAAANQWVAEHPLMNTDKEYTADALDAHTAAMARGHAPGSPAYLGHINTTLTRLYGKNHGHAADDDDKADTGARNGASMAASPGRESSSGFSHNGLRLITGSDGKYQVSGNIPAEWRDAAKWSKMTEADYCVAQLLAAKERKEDNSGAQEYSGGVIYR